ncbi:putative R3H domain, Cold shock domain, nucleic acid-binding, R3H domain superfamily [Plasmopara halstedii]
MFRTPQPGDWAAEDEDISPLPALTLAPVTPAPSSGEASVSKQRNERSDIDGRIEQDMCNSERRFESERGRSDRDRKYDRGKVIRDRGDYDGGRFDRSGHYDRHNDRSGRFYDRHNDRNGLSTRDNDRDQLNLDNDRSRFNNRDNDRNGRFERDHGRYEGGGRADVSHWGRNGDRRKSGAQYNMPVEQGYIVSIKESFGFVSSLDRDGDLFFHISEAPIDIQLQDEVEYRVKYNQRSDKEMACQLVSLAKGTIKTEEVSDEWYDGIVTKSLLRGGSRGYAYNRDDDRRHREEYGLIEVKKSIKESETEQEGTVEQTQADEDVKKKTLAKRELIRFTSESLAAISVAEDEGHTDRAKVNLTPHFGDEVRFKIARHRKTGGKRAVDLTITVSAREKLNKEVEAKLAMMTREMGVVDRVKYGGGFIKCCDRPIELYFSFDELLEDIESRNNKDDDSKDEHHTGRQGKGPYIGEGDEVSFFVYEEQEDDSRHSRRRLSALRVQKLPAGSVSFEQLLRSDVEGVVKKVPKEPRNSPEVFGSIAKEIYPQEIVEVEDNVDISEENKKVKNGIEGQKVAFRLCDTEDPSYIPHIDDKVVFDEVLDKRTRRIKAVKVRFVQLCQKNRETGVINGMKDEFGFIKCVERFGDAYFRFSDVMGMNRNFSTGTEVAFDVVVDTKSDHVRATRVQLLPRGTVKWEAVLLEGVEGKILGVPASRGGHSLNRGGRGDKVKHLQKLMHGRIGCVAPNKQHLIDFLPELKQKLDAVFITSKDGKDSAEGNEDHPHEKNTLRIAFPSTLSKFERAALHEYSDWLGLQHRSIGEDSDRHLEIFGSDTISLDFVKDKLIAAPPEITATYTEDDVDDVRYHPRVDDRVKFDLVLVKRTKQFQCRSIKCVESTSSRSNAATPKTDAVQEEGVIVSLKSEGFGFIMPVQTVPGVMEENLFFHIKEITTGQTLADLKEGTEVQFTRLFDERKKRKRATAISVVPAGTIKTTVRESVRGIVTKASVLHRISKNRFAKSNSKSSSVGRIRLATTSSTDDDNASTDADDKDSEEEGGRKVAEVGTSLNDTNKQVRLKKPGKQFYQYYIHDITDPAVIVREGDEVEFIPQVTPKNLRAAHIRLVTSHAKQGVVTHMGDQGGIIRLDGEGPVVEARFVAQSVLRGDTLNEGDCVEFAYLPFDIASRNHNVQKGSEEKEEIANQENELIRGQALSILCLSSNRATTSQTRGSRTVNSTLKEAMRQIGGNAMVASRTAKGPNGTRGFVEGWNTKDEETKTMEESAATSHNDYKINKE